MKKSSSLAEQVLKAQKALDSWPDSIKSSMRLEGSDIFLKTSSDSRYFDSQEVKRKAK